MTRQEYLDYLVSPQWQSLRIEKLAECGNRCQACGNNDVSLHCHHRHYETLGHESSGDLVILCRLCHEELHDILRSGGISETRTTAAMMILRRKYGHRSKRGR